MPRVFRQLSSASPTHNRVTSGIRVTVSPEPEALASSCTAVSRAPAGGALIRVGAAAGLVRSRRPRATHDPAPNGQPRTRLRQRRRSIRLPGAR